MKSMLFSSTAVLMMVAMPAMAETAANSANPDDVIVVYGSPFSTTDTTNVISPDQSANTAPDAATLANLVPGGAVVGNGPVSGQFQYRGMFGPRVDVRIDGQAQASGCPNLMDPPLSNAPLPLISRLEVARGIAPVRFGPGIGGSVVAVMKKMPFSNDGKYHVGTDVEAGWRSVDDAYRAGGMTGIANDRTAVSLLVSYEHGGNLHTPVGVLADSGHDRLVAGLGVEQKIGQYQVFGIEYRHTKIRDTGNPPLPMDLMLSDVDSIGAHWKMEKGAWTAKARVGFDHVYHIMDNYSLRPVALPAKSREATAHARAWTYTVSFARDMGANGTVSFGLDGNTDDHSVAISSPVATAFYVTSFPNTKQHRTGAWAQWDGDLAPKLSADLGFRVDQTWSDAGLASASSMLPPAVQMLKMAYNAADRQRDDTTADMVLRLRYKLDDNTSLRLAAGQKSRVPGYVERYGWLPANSSNGLADGHIYVGNLDLKPEISRELTAGVDWSNARAYARPSVYWRNVDDYITGVPVMGSTLPNAMSVTMVASMNGDPNPLYFANVPARLYGADMDFGVKLNPEWRLDGVASYVHGERRDIDDGLYRLPPARATLSLTREARNWSVTLDGHLVADQTNVSTINNETSTDGHVRFDLRGQWLVRDGVNIQAGVENIFDASYVDALSGINRVAGSDIAVGEKIPGAGRGVFVRLILKTDRALQ